MLDLVNLEQNQRQHQLYQSLSRNVSASNDPMQLQHDSNELLIKGAQVLSEGRNMGLNDEQVMDVALQRFQQSDIPNAGIRTQVQTGATNAADKSVLQELMKRGRR